MKILIDKHGNAHHIYNDDFKLDKLKQYLICRASEVEPGQNGWYVDMSKVKGPLLGPFKRRDEAIAAEIKWLEENYLNGSSIQN